MLVTMVKSWQTLMVLLGVWAVAQPILNTPAEAQLSPFFYFETCPQVYPIVAKGVFNAIQEETRNAASLLRLHFHDCFVQGCDGSILLNSTATNNSEQNAPPNINSIRGYGIIDGIKASLESSCPGVVSCADIVALSAFFSVVLSGGPIWWVPLGRRDSEFSNFPLFVNLPPPFGSISTLKQLFANQNLTVTDLVALSGAHTIGLTHCSVTTGPNGRIYNFSDTGRPDPTLNTIRLKQLQKRCPLGGDGNVTLLMDILTPTVFDNLYYKDVIEGNGIFQSDEELFGAANDTKALVQKYASDQLQFFDDFANSMIKMSKLNVLTGTAGQIRKNCAVSNTATTESLEKIVNSGSEEPRRSESAESEDVVQKSEIPMEEDKESAVEFFRHVVKQVVEEIMFEKLHQELVEDTTASDTVTGGHSSM